jgi:hypothetical protein
MRLSERLSANIFSILLRPFLKRFEGRSPEDFLRRSDKMLDTDATADLRAFVRSRQHPSGGFVDRAGNPDLYYTLFGYYLANALGLNEILAATGKYAENEAGHMKPDGIHLQCAAILIAELSDDRKLLKALRRQISRNLNRQLKKQPEYGAFVTLLTCWHTGDFISVLRIMRHLKRLEENDNLPSTVIASLVVMLSSFDRPAGNLINRLIAFSDKNGGFRAVKAAPLPDMLSTAVSLYALRYSGYDLRMIRPECLSFIDAHYASGGFCSNMLDRDADLEYTFYGLLALGSLAD